jgi:DNA-binding MarR family transcriptional regulator
MRFGGFGTMLDDTMHGDAAEPADKGGDTPTQQALALLLEQAVRSFYPDRSPQDMHPGQWAALRYLARANPEARTIAGVGRYLGVTIGPASRAVAALERKQLVSVSIDPIDKRIRRLVLTSVGAALLAQDPLRVAARRLDVLTPDQRASLAAAVMALLDTGVNDKPDPFVLTDSGS